MYYLMLTGAAMLLGADFALNKIYQKFYGTAPKAAFFFNSLLGLITAVIFFCINGFKLEFTVYSFVMAGLMGLFVMSYNVPSIAYLQRTLYDSSFYYPFFRPKD